ncbi:hypothetical protein ACFUVV_09255 [Streptomyces sp. NPDC057376]|uniref:hypothetical protein n=1 Tax=unclassified Streptomyces TaxID=2593676 RepID=UPI000B22A243|nr:hypothetical protein [Streptomyces sp. CB02414]
MRLPPPGQPPGQRAPGYPGTRQRAQLRTRVADIAWTAPCVVLALWAVWSAVGVARGGTAWAYCAVAWVLLAGAPALRTLAVRRRTSW